MKHLRPFAVIGWLLAPVPALAADAPPAARSSEAPPALAAAVPASPGTAAAASSEATGRVIDRAAERLMVDFCGLLTAADRFSFQLDASFDEVLRTGTRVQYHKSSEVVVQRPDRLRVDAESDKGARSFFYDGKTLAVYDPDRNLYAVFPAPPTLDAMLDAAEDRGLTIPLNDLARSKPCAGLAELTRTGHYAGRHYFNGEPHHHLVFVTDGADIQLWLDTGEVPLLRKVVIDYRALPGAPRYEGVLTDWSFEPAIEASTFTFTVPQQAVKVELREAGTAEGGKTP
ncbi:MAG: DUF2092 domain-containing protein [Gammaproteobacteria bacterium]|nr:DUF2092 domain-containing protein [Gammaproteobacteria bacterium]